MNRFFGVLLFILFNIIIGVSSYKFTIKNKVKYSSTSLNLFGFGNKKEVTKEKPVENKPTEVRVNKFQGYGRDIFKKTDEKKDIVRLTKNIIFPGIYQDYEDTKEVKETIVVGRTALTVVTKPVDVGKFNGGYNVMDEKIYDANKSETKLPPVKKPADFVAPTPKKSLGLYTGVKCIPDVSKYPRPKKPIILYDDFKSPACQKVREACSMLDLIVEIRPCPGAAYGFTDILKTASLGKDDIPFMFDNNPSMIKVSLYGSNDIIEHLFESYGPGINAIPKNLKGGTGAGVSKGKGSYNSKARYDNVSMKPIQLYGWEGASFVKPVRETLNSLALPHILINCAEGSNNRKSLESIEKTFQVPYINDPNTGVKMFESKEIVNYLLKTYCVN